MKKMIKRTLSWVLTLAMVLSFVPAISMQSIAAADDFIVERIVDDSTMDQLIAERDYEELNYYILNAMLKG